MRGMRSNAIRLAVLPEVYGGHSPHSQEQVPEMQTGKRTPKEGCDCLMNDTTLTLLQQIQKGVVNRDYRTINDTLDRCLYDASWQEIMEHLREESDYDSMLTRGVIRDAIIEILDLRLLQGLDGDLTRMLEGLKGENLVELREEALPLAVSYMEKQIRQGNTFFLDPTAMSEHGELARLVPKILEVREKQILRLEPNPPLSDVYSTYYGFNILTQGSLKSDTAGATLEATQGFNDLAVQFGRELEVKNIQLKYTKTAFGRLSEELRSLLWNILCVCVAGKNNRIRAIKELGELRNSRALDILHARLFSTEHEPTKRAILEALKKISHPSSWHVLEKQASDNKTTKLLQDNVKSSLFRWEHADKQTQRAVESLNREVSP